MTDALPKVSILIIAYNQVNSIGEAIESALGQDYSNLEVFYDGADREPHPLSRVMAKGVGAGPIIRQLPSGATAVMFRRDRIPAHGFEPSLPTVSDAMPATARVHV